MEEEDFYYDMCNIARILPTLSSSTIYTELNTLRNDSERVQIIIRKYFQEYEPEKHNCMTEDIKIIKRVLPTHPIVKISNDLLSVEDKENRVQIVVKKYFDNENITLKRCLDNEDITGISTGKKLKLGNDSTDFNSETVDQIDNVSNKEHSSNETENYSPTKEDFQSVIDQLIPQESQTGNIEVTSNIQIETTKQTAEDNIVSHDVKNQIFDCSKETNDECNTEICNEVKESGQTLLSILSNLFPQHSSDVFSAICEDFGVNLHCESNENTIDLVVTSFLNFTSNANKFEQDQTAFCENQSSVVSSDSQVMESSSMLHEKSKNVADCDLENCLTETVEDFVLNINNTDDASSAVQTSSISEEPVQTTNLKPENTLSLENLNPFLPSNEPTVSTSKISNNIESSRFDYSESTNDLINNSDLELNRNRYDIPFNIPSTSTLEDNFLLNNNIVKLRNELRTTSHISNSNFNQLLKGNIEEINNYSNIDHRLFHTVHTSPTTNNLQPALQIGAEKSVLTSHSLIKPATFHPTSSKPNVLKTDLERVTNTSKVIMKPASFHPKSNITAMSTHTKTTGINKIINTNTNTSSEINRPSTKSKCGFSKNLSKTNLSLYSKKYLNLPSTSGINNNINKQTNNQASSNSSYIATTNKQDVNKNRIQVRTDLYDTYFNGPVLQSTKIKNMNKQDENDDIIFVSAERIPSDSAINVTTNTEFKIKEDQVEVISDTSQQSTSNASNMHPFYFKLLEIFPDICPNYLRQICFEIKENQTMDDLINVLLNGSYKKRDRPVSPEGHLDFEEQNKILQDLFPDADPTYLQHHCERLIDQPKNFKEFVASLLENKNYPTKVEYLKKMKLSAQEKQYTTEFNVKNFLEVIPNPENYFNDPKRQVITGHNFDDINYAITFLKNKFCTTAIKDITSVFRKTNYSILHSAKTLEKLQNMKSKRKPYPVTSCKNIPLLQEIAYVKHRKQIQEYILNQESEKQIAKENAKASGLMKTCQCCFDDEVMPDDTETCKSGQHIFCKSCIRKGCEVLIGDGKLEFPCLESCDSFFTLQVLQIVLAPKIFSKMAQRKQLEEVKSAGIEDLESCPFCDFATIPALGDKIFRCLNDDCMKESCRLCKEPSHIPLRCDEVEKDKDVKMRTYIENKMTEALLRKCYKCGLKFIKESGCNKMTCSCGAMMCYVCNEPVKDYKHFNGQGGDKFQLCPLYSDTHKLHADAVKRSAESAKKELGLQKEDQLKIDPASDLEQHYRRLAEQNPAIPNIPPPLLLPQNVLPR